MELIKTKKIGDKYLSIIYWDVSDTYDVEYSNEEGKIEYVVNYTNKKDALEMFNNWEKEMVIKRLEEC